MWAPILDSEKEQTEFSFTMQRDAVLFDNASTYLICTKILD